MSQYLPWLFIIQLLLVSAASHSQPVRFEADALRQDGKVTLTPSFTPDGKRIYFAQSECSPIWECPQRLKTSELTPDGWSHPELVPLPEEARVDWPNVTPDGQRLVFSWSAVRPGYAGLDIYENFDLYTLDLGRSDAVPEPIRGADINRPRAGANKKLRFVHNETLPSVTARGDLYFMTERLDGVGERDIYVADRKADGSFATARPLPAPVNSSGRDDGVWVNPQGDLMLLSYPDRGGQGGADLFVSVRRNGNWQEPLNLGASINSEFAEFGARLTPDNKHILFTSDRPVGDSAPGLLQVWIADFPALNDD